VVFIASSKGAFDECHLELLSVLAGEVSIAIENARLFYEERTKAHHLSLLYIFFRNAIATINPEETLAKVWIACCIRRTYAVYELVNRIYNRAIAASQLREKR
jgi:hypothetical protein